MPDELKQLAESVYYFPFNPDYTKVEPNVGVIITRHQTILVDAGNGPRHARRILSALKEMHAPPISHIVYTHHHWDHVFGACVFKAPAIGHILCRELLLESAARPWGSEYLKDEIRKNPGLEASYTAIGNAIEDWSEFLVVPPSITFSDKMDLYLDSLSISMERVQGEHAPDSIVVLVRERGVIFLGDCYYVPPLHLRTSQSKGSAEILKSFVDQPISLYVDAHNPPKSKNQVMDLLTSIQI